MQGLPWRCRLWGGCPRGDLAGSIGLGTWPGQDRGWVSPGGADSRAGTTSSALGICALVPTQPAAPQSAQQPALASSGSTRCPSKPIDSSHRRPLCVATCWFDGQEGLLGESTGQRDDSRAGRLPGLSLSIASPPGELGHTIPAQNFQGKANSHPAATPKSPAWRNSSSGWGQASNSPCPAQDHPREIPWLLHPKLSGEMGTGSQPSVQQPAWKHSCV